MSIKEKVLKYVNYRGCVLGCELDNLDTQIEDIGFLPSCSQRKARMLAQEGKISRKLVLKKGRRLVLYEPLTSNRTT